MLKFYCRTHKIPFMESMNYRTVVEILRLHDKKVLTKGKWPPFILHVLLVAERIRDAFLVDGVAITPETAFQVIQKIENILGTSGELAVLGIGDDGDDVVITRWDVIREKCLHLKTHCNDGLGLNIVDLQESSTNLLTGVELLYICQCVERAVSIDGIATPPSGPVRIPQSGEATHDEFKRFVGYPLLAGWLLGYPFIYRSIQAEVMLEGGGSGAASSSSQALSMTTLRKVSILGDIAKTFAGIAKECGFPMTSETIDIMEFTVPVSVLLESPSAADELREWIDRKKEHLSKKLFEQQSVRSRNSSGDTGQSYRDNNCVLEHESSISLVDCIRVETGDVMLPSLVL
jgi:Domain of unknown function (DUF4504)